MDRGLLCHWSCCRHPGRHARCRWWRIDRADDGGGVRCTGISARRAAASGRRYVDGVDHLYLDCQFTSTCQAWRVALGHRARHDPGHHCRWPVWFAVCRLPAQSRTGAGVCAGVFCCRRLDRAGPSAGTLARSARLAGSGHWWFHHQRRVILRRHWWRLHDHSLSAVVRCADAAGHRHLLGGGSAHRHHRQCRLHDHRLFRHRPARR